MLKPVLARNDVDSVSSRIDSRQRLGAGFPMRRLERVKPTLTISDVTPIHSSSITPQASAARLINHRATHSQPFN
jgi:hypothetical protein